eukprot:scaffold155351_cov31-Tisochrysis_lutea.AAC.3
MSSWPLSGTREAFMPEACKSPSCHPTHRTNAHIDHNEGAGVGVRLLSIESFCMPRRRMEKQEDPGSGKAGASMWGSEHSSTDEGSFGQRGAFSAP